MKAAAKKVAPKAAAMKAAPKAAAMKAADKTAIKLVHPSAMKAHNVPAKKRPSAKGSDVEPTENAGARHETKHGLQDVDITPYDRIKFKKTMDATLEKAHGQGS